MENSCGIRPSARVPREFPSAKTWRNLYQFMVLLLGVAQDGLNLYQSVFLLLGWSVIYCLYHSDGRQMGCDRGCTWAEEEMANAGGCRRC